MQTGLCSGSIRCCDIDDESAPGLPEDALFSSDPNNVMANALHAFSGNSGSPPNTAFEIRPAADPCRVFSVFILTPWRVGNKVKAAQDVILTVTSMFP
jgi:hypothetical protein